MLSKKGPKSTKSWCKGVANFEVSLECQQPCRSVERSVELQEMLIFRLYRNNIKSFSRHCTGLIARSPLRRAITTAFHSKVDCYNFGIHRYK